MCYQLLCFGLEMVDFMARKETITKTYLFETAFEMLREEGIENITARKLAAKAGCSTQPIFRVYENMEELWQELFEEAVDYFENYYNKAKLYDFTPFVNLGITYIEFAMKEKHLFQLLFLSVLQLVLHIDYIQLHHHYILLYNYIHPLLMEYRTVQYNHMQ